MPFAKSMKQVYPGLGSPTAYNTNINAACAAGNTTISIPMGSSVSGPISVGMIRVKSEPAAVGVNAQLRILDITADDGANTVLLRGAETVLHGINQNVDELYEFCSDLALVNVNVAINVLNNTTNISVEVAGGP